MLAISGSPAFLISEALRGAGAVVTDRAGRRFLLDTDPRGELAPRDIVARTIWQELARTGEKSVLLDCRPVGGDTAVRFPAIAARCIDHGIDITATPIPIAPAAHYMIGGIRTDIDGATSVPGLYACGEVASTGVHGANRLASNSLLEGAVFGPRTMEAALRGLAEVAPSALPVADVGSAPLEDPPAAEARSRIARVMGRDCGVVRHGKGLRAALGELDDIVATPIGSLSGRSAHLSAVAAYCIANAALYREESRGAHYRDDHPDTSHQWHGVTVMHTTRGATTHDRNVAADH
ncbi:MAG: hypothetical protein DLM65_11205 [Candidatus Aeolococcus gillhamiae]|uniref:L-aspartate oxidase n=1 Tax=Candidatus Aeolococcus gillhamiae TaxID=3127015 RepID=A0A2W5Z8P6_9BACT|nr:MAG: hypothetical protein DLM65_11205 [Candidatus Dormibacter sp. RRmetagenome_bin12]